MQEEENESSSRTRGRRRGGCRIEEEGFLRKI